MATLDLPSHQPPKSPKPVANRTGAGGAVKGLKHVDSGKRSPATRSPVGLGESCDCREPVFPVCTVMRMIPLAVRRDTVLKSCWSRARLWVDF